MYDFLDENNIAEEINDHNSLGLKVIEDFKTGKIFDEKKIKNNKFVWRRYFQKNYKRIRSFF